MVSIFGSIRQGCNNASRSWGKVDAWRVLLFSAALAFSVRNRALSCAGGNPHRVKGRSRA